jgi:hypothetical protein
MKKVLLAFTVAIISCSSISKQEKDKFFQIQIQIQSNEGLDRISLRLSKDLPKDHNFQIALHGNKIEFHETKNSEHDGDVSNFKENYYLAEDGEFYGILYLQTPFFTFLLNLPWHGRSGGSFPLTFGGIAYTRSFVVYME